MNWLAKVAAHKVLSAIPGGLKIYNSSRKNITRSIVPDRARVEQRVNIGMQYLETLEKLGSPGRLKAGAHLDFGCGYHPTIPLLYYSLGCERQFLFDAIACLDESLLDNTITVFLEIVNDPSWPHRDKIRRLPKEEPGRPLAEHLEAMGMSYAAPCGGSFSALTASIDVITSTTVLYYIGREELKEIIESIHSSLRKGGYFMATMRLEDEYADNDRSISRYNYLRYSPWVWEKLVNSRTMSYNRLRPRDYRELLESAGLRIEQFDVEGPTPADLEELRHIRVHPSFAHYSQEELGAKFLTFTASKI